MRVSTALLCVHRRQAGTQGRRCDATRKARQGQVAGAGRDTSRVDGARLGQAERCRDRRADEDRGAVCG